MFRPLRQHTTATLLNILVCGPLLAAACGSPTSPTDTPQNPKFTVTGTVRATNDNQVVAGATVTLKVITGPEQWTQVATSPTDAAGRFSMVYNNPPTDAPPDINVLLMVSAPGYITRTAYIQPKRSREANVEVFREDSTFDLTYYRGIARNGFRETAFNPLRSLAPVTRSSFQLLMATTDWQGTAIDPTRIDAVAAIVIEAVGIISGGRITISGTERGSHNPSPVPGYLQVGWMRSGDSAFLCGDSYAPNGDALAVSLASTGCSCGGQIDPVPIRHLLGHAMGLLDTPNDDELMWERNDFVNNQRFGSTSSCDVRPTAREQRYWRYLQSRPFGNTDPDDDPLSALLP